MTPLLRVEHLSKSFGGFQVSRDISFSLRRGERVALIGPNGAGKTTLINLISGTQKPTSGRIYLKDRDVTGLGIMRRARLGLVRSFQTSRLFREQTVFENVALPILQRTGGTSHIFGNAAPPAVAREANEILNRLGLEGLAQCRVSSISYGEQRLVELAMALALLPDVLLLDEPAAGAGSAEALRVLQVIAQLPAEMAILLIDHDMGLVFRFAARVMVMAAGSVIFDGAPSEAANNEDVRRAYLGSLADGRAIA